MKVLKVSKILKGLKADVWGALLKSIEKQSGLKF